MKQHIGLAVALLLSVAACTDRRPEAPAQDANAVLIEEIKRQVAELEKRSGNELAVLKGCLDKVAGESKSAATDLQQQILLKNQRISELETRLYQLQNETRTLRQAQETRKTDAPLPVPPPADPFPLRVFSVEGVKVVTGSHTTVRPVETSEVLGKDVFGEPIKGIRMEDIVVDDYGYQARFSIENPTQEPIEISAGAGLKTEHFRIPAGETLTGLAVDSVMGSDLRVTVGNHTRRFPVTY